MEKRDYLRIKVSIEVQDEALWPAKTLGFTSATHAGSYTFDEVEEIISSEVMSSKVIVIDQLRFFKEGWSK